MFEWLFEVSQANRVAQAIGLIAFVCALGMAIGSVKAKGIGLGSAAVLFIGIVVARFSEPIDKDTLDFVKEFGLVLFVFAIGLQLGPSFFESFRSDGLRLNLLAASLVALAGILAPLLGMLFGVEKLAFAGLFAGASTNSPALGAAQQSLATLPGLTREQLSVPALACAVSYPIAIAGLLVTLVILKTVFRIDPVQEAKDLAAAREPPATPLNRRTLVVENRSLEGLTLEEVYRRAADEVVISRIRFVGEKNTRTALSKTRLHFKDVVLAIGADSSLDRLQELVGPRSEEDLMLAPGDVTFRRIFVTHKRAFGRTIEQLGLEDKFGVEVTRISRGDVEMTAVPALRLQFGDVVQVVGPAQQMDGVSRYLGDSLKKLNETQFIPLFAGITLGVLIGSVPIALPGLSAPLRIGLAGGPLVVALCLGRIGHLGGLVWHMPRSANHAFREFGVAIFFAALGLAAGDQFFAAVFSPRGIVWAGVGAIVTIAPLAAIGAWARVVQRMNFATLGGLLSGAMTNPPALTFVSNICRSDAPALAYATVYPLATLLRILVAQVLATLVD